jgi:uncharacterized membrane protein
MEVPGFLRGRLEKAGGGYHEYVILRTQFGTLALFVFAVFMAFSASLLSFALLLVVTLLLLLLNFYSAFRQLRGIRSHRAYKYFFGGLNVFGALLAFSNFMLTGFEPVFALAFLAALALFLIGFQVGFRRNFVFGEVLLADQDWAVVHIQYDICSGTKNGYYAVRGRKGIKRGDEVKIDIAHALGERRTPWRITS